MNVGYVVIVTMWQVASPQNFVPVKEYNICWFFIILKKRVWSPFFNWHVSIFYKFQLQASSVILVIQEDSVIMWWFFGHHCNICLMVTTHEHNTLSFIAYLLHYNLCIDECIEWKSMSSSRIMFLSVCYSFFCDIIGYFYIGL